MEYPKVTALAGGVGGAKMVFGLAQVLPVDNLNIIVNTGDDFDYYGLNISPDLDSVVYALAGLSDPIKGFGRANDSSIVFDTLVDLGEDPWFRLGDMDLALNIKRTNLINNGRSLSEVTKEICNNLGVNNHVFPMTDSKASTRIDTKEYGTLDFQEYFVKYQWKPTINNIDYSDFENTYMSEISLKAINNCDYLIICPSNPWLSIFPILKLKNTKTALQNKRIIAVSPIIGNQAVKGPAAKLFYDLGLEPSAIGVARLYEGLIATIVMDHINKDEVGLIQKLGIKTYVTDIMMNDNDAKIRLASEVIDLIRTDSL